MWKIVQRTDHSHEVRIETARHLGVFTGEGAYGAELLRMIRTIDRTGYRGDWSFEVFNDDYAQMPGEAVALRARTAAI